MGTNALFRQKETLSYSTNNIPKYIKESVSESIGINKHQIQRLSHQAEQLRNRNQSLFQKYRANSPSNHSHHSHHSHSQSRKVNIIRKDTSNSPSISRPSM